MSQPGNGEEVASDYLKQVIHKGLDSFPAKEIPWHPSFYINRIQTITKSFTF